MHAGDHADMSIFGSRLNRPKCSYCRRKIKPKDLTEIEVGTDEGTMTLKYHTKCVQPLLDNAEIKQDVG